MGEETLGYGNMTLLKDQSVRTFKGILSIRGMSFKIFHPDIALYDLPEGLEFDLIQCFDFGPDKLQGA